MARRAHLAGAKLPTALPGHWVANETPDVLAHDGLPAPPDGALYNVLALDGEPLAWTRSHGQAMTWFGPTAELSGRLL